LQLTLAEDQSSDPCAGGRPLRRRQRAHCAGDWSAELLLALSGARTKAYLRCSWLWPKTKGLSPASEGRAPVGPVEGAQRLGSQRLQRLGSAFGFLWPTWSRSQTKQDEALGSVSQSPAVEGARWCSRRNRRTV